MEILDTTIGTTQSKAHLIKIAIYYGILASATICFIISTISILSQLYAFYDLAMLISNRFSLLNITLYGLIATYFANKTTQLFRRKTGNNTMTLCQCISIAFIMAFVDVIVGILWGIAIQMFFTHYPIIQVLQSFNLLMIKASGISFIINGVLISVLICLLLRKQLFENP